MRLFRFIPLRFVIVAVAVLCATTGLSLSAQTIGTDASTLTVASSVTTGVQDTTSITITATETALSGSVVPTGWVLFFSNGNPIFAQQLVSGQATREISTLASGANIITASYIGDTNFAAENSSNSVTINITGLTGAYVLGASTPTTTTIVQGKTAVFSLPITATPTFGGTVTFACSGAPAQASCTVSPTTVSFTAISGPSAAPQTSTVSIVFATTESSAIKSTQTTMLLRSFGGISAAGLFLMLLPRQRGRRWNALTLVAVLGLGLCSITTLSGCGGSNNNSTTTSNATGAGTYPLTITATSGATTQTATVNVTVSQ